jgi:hypothetical protein
MGCFGAQANKIRPGRRSGGHGYGWIDWMGLSVGRHSAKLVPHTAGRGSGCRDVRMTANPDFRPSGVAAVATLSWPAWPGPAVRACWPSWVGSAGRGQVFAFCGSDIQNQLSVVVGTRCTTGE